MSEILIHPNVARAEDKALLEYYMNRTLVLAQEKANLSEDVTRLQQHLAELEASAEHTVDHADLIPPEANDDAG